MAESIDIEAKVGLYYTYIWRDAKGVPFYVGKGIKRRAWDTNRRSKSFKEIHSQGGCSVEIVDYFVHQSQAHANEMELIFRFGRRDSGAGPLVNMTDGGDGSVGLSEEVRKKISAANTGNKYSLGVIRSDETRLRISNSKKGSKTRLGAVLSRETKDKISQSLMGHVTTLAHRIKLSEATKGVPKTADQIANVTAALHMCPPRSDSSSGYKGVCKNKTRWVARITVGGERRTIGYFPEAQDAAKAYDAAAVKAWGNGNCYLNFEKGIAA